MEENKSVITETRTCVRCGKEIRKDYVACPYCGKKVKGAPSFSKPLFGTLISAGLSMLLFIVGMILFFIGIGKDLRLASVLLVLSGIAGLVYIPFGLKVVEKEKNREVATLYLSLFSVFALFVFIIGNVLVFLAF